MTTPATRNGYCLTCSKTAVSAAPTCQRKDCPITVEKPGKYEPVVLVDHKRKPEVLR